VGDRADHSVLPDQILETGRTVFACQHPVRLCIACGGLCIACGGLGIACGGLGSSGCAKVETALVGAVGLVVGSASVSHRSIRNVNSLGRLLRKGANGASADAAAGAIRSEKQVGD